MGLYEIKCPVCNVPCIWFSGTIDQRCVECKKKEEKHIKAMNVCNELSEFGAKNGFILGVELQSKLLEILTREDAAPIKLVPSASIQSGTAILTDGDPKNSVIITNIGNKKE